MTGLLVHLASGFGCGERRMAVLRACPVLGLGAGERCMSASCACTASGSGTGERRMTASPHTASGPATRSGA